MLPERDLIPCGTTEPMKIAQERSMGFNKGFNAAVETGLLTGAYFRHHPAVQKTQQLVLLLMLFQRAVEVYYLTL